MFLYINKTITFQDMYLLMLSPHRKVTLRQSVCVCDDNACKITYKITYMSRRDVEIKIFETLFLRERGRRERCRMRLKM